MPLRDGYGFGVGTPQGEYHCAIDVDSKHNPDGVEWRVVALSAGDMAQFSQMLDGFHPLVSNATSGAMDYIRSRMLHPPIGITRARHGGLLLRVLDLVNWNPPWKHGTGMDALTDLEAVLADAARCYVFGEPFTHHGQGVHNVHQNQGDPVGSSFAAENAIWQDGATIIESAAGVFTAFLNKFKEQRYQTDDDGHPI